MQTSIKKYLHAFVCHTLTLVALLILTAGSVAAQEVVRITGKVVSKDDKEPLMGVNISDNNTHRGLAVTDVDGRFAVNVRLNTMLRFSMVGAKTQTLKVKDSKFIEVKMETEDVEIGEVVVATKRITDKIMPEPTDIEIRGNYFHVRTRVRVPREMFKRDTRLVVQPVLNNNTRKQIRFMRPMVYDAVEYNQTQDRLYTYNINDSVAGDPLHKFITVKNKSLREKGRTNDIIGYNDSLYVENIKDEYSCDVYMAIEDYTHILYRDTTIIARGTVNPLRWLDYSFSAKNITDAAYLPQPEKQMRDSHGYINLRFPIGKAKIDFNDPQNKAEIAKLSEQIDAIRHTKDATLDGVSLKGVSSPDGRYDRNMQLARQRMDFAVNYLRQQVPADLRQHVEFTSKAQVAPWTDVVTLLKRDTLTTEAEQLQGIINRYNSIDMQSSQARRLPFYHKLLEAKYLPQLRTVDYTLNYSIFRLLTIDEIRELYAKDYRQLSRYEFHELYSNEPDAKRREQMMRQALEMYPSFMVAANDLSTMLINRGMADETLLKPFAGANAPMQVNQNQMIALLNAGHFAAADSIDAFVPDDADNELLHAINGLLNGRSEGNADVVAKTGKRNQLLVLLLQKRNDEALKLSKELPDDEALTHYLRAICLNRTEDAVGAYEELMLSFKMDPALESVARVDGDVCDLLMDKNKEL